MEVQLPLQILQEGDAAIVQAFTTTLRAMNRRVKLAFVDHVSSFPPVRMPVKDIARQCRAAGAQGVRE